jgi:glycosyltransferase involved in cell wall biosynthesis
MVVSLREASLRRQVAHLMQERRQLRSSLEARGATIDEQARQGAGLAAERADLIARIEALETQLAAVYASRSWRSTALARKLVNVGRGLTGPAAGLPDVALRLPARGISAPSLPLPALASKATADRIAAPAARSTRRRLLIAADMPPLFDQQSGALRLKTLIDMLGRDGWSMVFASLMPLDGLPGVLATATGRERYETALREAGVDDIRYGLRDIDAFLENQGAGLDAAFLSFPIVADPLLPLVRARCPSTRIIFDMVDFHALRTLREARLRGDAALIAEAERQQAIELACVRASDVTVAITRDEKAALLDLVPEAVVEVVPNVFDVPRRKPPGIAGRRDLFFVGGFWHKPNKDAVLWFVERILPLIHAAAPEVIFRIAGSNMDDEVLALGAQPGVEVLGFVEDLQPEFDRHRVCVAPLRYGAGMKGKVGQSMMLGLPVVATSIGAEGMDLVSGEHILVADDEQGFAEETLRLLRDDELWTRLAGLGALHIQQTLSIEAVSDQLRLLFRA